MASFTEKYNLGFFDFGDELTTDYSVQIEINRWRLLDSLIYGFMSILGNGVIEGWELTASPENKLTLQITSGRGIINYFSGITEYPSEIELLSNNVYYIYAVRSDINNTDFTFVSNLFPIENPDYLFLGIASTGATSIETIDMTDRQEIDLIEQIKEEIKVHRHRGGENNPSKINLQTDVKNQLPSFRIQDFDAAKITTGTLDLVRIPLISHNLLQNIGQLTHPQIESFIKTLEVTNKELFGEVATANLLQQHIIMKYLHDDVDSPFYWTNGPFDKDFLNEFTYIPGISPDSFADVENTTAIIDTELHEVRGIPPTQGSSYFITYDTDAAWNTAYSMENVTAINDVVTLVKSTEGTEQKIIENFEGSSDKGEVLSDGSVFKKEIINLTPNDAQMVSESSILDVSEGAFSADVTTSQSFRLQYVKEWTTGQDWSDYDSFLIDVKCADSVHGSVRLYFIDSNNNESPHYVLLSENETTSNDENRGFETRIITISSLAFSDDILKMVIYVDDLQSAFNFYMDNIVLERAILLPPEGKMVIRYSASSPVIFNSLDWNVLLPTGTDIKIRAKSANGTVLLSRADYTSWLNSGEVIGLRGTDIQVEITFLPDVDFINAPSLTKLRMSLLSDAEIEGFEIDELNEWTRGDLSNVKLTSTTNGKADVSLETPIYVGSHYYANGNTAQQIVLDQTDPDNPFNRSEIALFGTNTPISPNHIIATIEKNGANATVQSSSFFQPKSALRLQNRNYLIADTFNDRILEINESAELVSGYGSVNYQFNKLFPIASCIDERNGILYLVWSRPVPFSTIDVNKLTIKTSTTTIPLRNNFDKISGYTQSELDSLNIEGQIMPIHLMDQNFALVKLLDSNIYLDVNPNIIEGGIEAGSVYYRAIKTFLGIPCFLGNFAYKAGIFAPTYAGSTVDKGYMVGNARLAVKTFIVPTDISGETITRTESFADIIELNESGDTVWGSPANWVNFSPFVPGRAEQVDKNTIIIAGIKPPTSTLANTIDFTYIAADPVTQASQKTLLFDLFKSQTGTAGIIYNYNKNEWTYITGPYTSAENVLISDADINSEGNLVIAETSFANSGRMITISNFGDITYSFGEGTYGLVNDLMIKSNNSMVIST